MEFSEVMRQWVRARKAIGEDVLSHYPLERFDDDVITRIEKEIMAWAKEHPESTRPTWRKLLDAAGITVRCDGTLQFNTRFDADEPVSPEFVRILNCIQKEE